MGEKDGAADSSRDAITGVSGTQAEYDTICTQMVQVGHGSYTLTKELLAGVLFWPDPIPRMSLAVEDRTFICSLSQERPDRPNHLGRSVQMKRKLQGLFKWVDCVGRTMYVRQALRAVGFADVTLGVQLTVFGPTCVHQHAGSWRGIGLPVITEIRKRTKASVPCMAHRRAQPLGPGQKMFSVAVRNFRKITSFTFRKRVRFGLTGARAMAATRC